MQDCKHSRSIDVHHHFFPRDLDKVKANDLAFWRAPPGTLPWCAENSIRTMDAMNIDVAILSIPPIAICDNFVESRTIARRHNIALRDLSVEYPMRFGFFATLPFLQDIDGALKEIDYALGVLHADGISLASSYGRGSEAKYLGHDIYEPIWAELHRRNAVVFVHGTQTPSSTPCPSELLGLPITEVPNETFKAAAHLVVTGRKMAYPNVNIILAHLGGNTVGLASRVAILSEHMGSELCADQILKGFQTFYYETALSAYEPNLLAVDAFAQEDRILFGTDFPAVGAKMAEWYTENLIRHYHVHGREKLDNIMSTNALRLFPRFN
ncbi:hypothetical protein AMATHDRAFT_79490 [Amanita thiersii Skay4041]|uniref:Amidohydrolase-related domain-containing protein n=1 Tax=Amanita thiersii Skay4041 TaxID=703135 RepID=A0A2A9NTW3_9AGAR|nr:hypothetical protein AMATHDRAFT_79490 [Amanita thiersii Skay4041]